MSDFFEAGVVYTRDLPYRAPEDRPDFHCVAVAMHPTTGGLRAFGFRRDGDGCPWGSYAMRVGHWAEGWVATPEGRLE